MNRKRDRMEGSVTSGGAGLSRRTDRAVRRAARAAEGAARGVTTGNAGPDYPVTRTMIDGEAQITEPLTGMVFGRTEELGRVLLMRTYFDQRGEIGFSILEGPEWAQGMVEFDLEVWWGRFMIGVHSKSIERPGDSILFKLKEGRDDG